MTTESTNKITEANRKAWNARRYEVWSSAYGNPAAEAERIVADPERIIRRISPYLEAIAGKRICNIQGSHGRIAVALALLGAKVHVIDFSEQNQRYALDLAAAANVSIDYSVCDIIKACDLNLPQRFDVLVLELGILHYHQDLNLFFAILRQLATETGNLLINEFHPVQRKLFWSEGPRHYFETDLVEADVPNPDTTGLSLGTCQYRFWTMGEIVTAAIKSGFRITRLDEHPDWSDPTIPGSFTLLASAVPPSPT